MGAAAGGLDSEKRGGNQNEHLALILIMQNVSTIEIAAKLEILIDRVESHIDEQIARMTSTRVAKEDEDALREMLDTLEQLKAYQDRLYATVH